MKFMLMMHAPRGTGDWSVFKWPPEDLKAHINFMKRFAKELKDAGELSPPRDWPGRIRPG